MKIFEYNNRHVNDKSEDLLRFLVKDNNIDELKNYPKVKQLHITGLKQKDFDYFVERYADDYDFIYFFKCPLIKDLSKLSKLSNVKYISFYWNNKADRLWDMSKNKNLKGIFINDMSKLCNLKDIESGASLNEFHISGGMWKNAKIETLRPIGTLKNLEYLSLINIDILDNDITPLFYLEKLKILRLDERDFDSEIYASLAVNLEKTECDCFKGYVKNDPYGDGKDVWIVGKKKPRLNPIKDAEKIQKYICEFEELKSHYKNKKC